MLRSIAKQAGESVESVRKKKRKATVRRICRKKVKVKFSHTRYRALGPELIPVYRQSAHR